MRLIDADELINDYISESASDDAEVITRRDVNNAPTVDAEIVRHGHWGFPIFADGLDAYDPRCECSVCGSIEIPLSRHNYCPCCGAKMDEVEEC